MRADIDYKSYYYKYIYSVSNDLQKNEEKLVEMIAFKDGYKEYVKKRSKVLEDMTGIALRSYLKEWVIGIYNTDEELLKVVLKKLEIFEVGPERMILLQLYKYLNILEKIKYVKLQIEVFKNRSKLQFKDYRRLVERYYRYGVHKCCIDGYAYTFSNGIGDLMINRWKFNTSKYNPNPKRMVDYNATRLNKLKLIEEGKKPYSEEEAKIYALRGLKYDGVPYVIYSTATHFYQISILNNTKFAKRKLEFVHAENVDQPLKGMTQKEIAATCKTMEEVYNLRMDLMFKLKVALYFDETLYINYIRNAEQINLLDGSHNSQNRQRF